MSKLFIGMLIQHKRLDWGTGIVLDSRTQTHRDLVTGEANKFTTQYRVWFPKLIFDRKDPRDLDRRWWFGASHFKILSRHKKTSPKSYLGDAPES